MKKDEIIKAIENKRQNTKYNIWTVGITNDPERRKNEHENEKKDVTYWNDWKADSETIARDVEAHFLEKGMKGGGGGGKNPNHVYVF